MAESSSSLPSFSTGTSSTANSSCHRTGSESAYCSEDECYDDSTHGGNTREPRQPFSSLDCLSPVDLEIFPINKREIEVDVAVIGNGPSAIFLSLLLSGYKPYFTGNHPNPVLKQKLRMDQSLLEQDIQYLSEGLEGRSNNPVSLLFDTLFHPNADMGVTKNSSIKWIQDESNKISHVVLGRSRPGGIWHNMDPSVLTLSKRDWLDLPIYSFDDWKKNNKTNVPPMTTPLPAKETRFRALTSDVAKYYNSYVHEMKLTENFIDGICIKRIKQSFENKTCFVTTPPPETTTPTLTPPITPLSPTRTIGISSEVGVTHCSGCCCDCGVSCPTIIPTPPTWEITGRTCTCCTRLPKSREISVTVRARKLVLACGLSKPKKLNVPGENLPFVLHDITQLKTKIHYLKSSSLNTDKPMVVIGAGMSAADAILLLMSQGLHVYHVFYQSLEDSFIFNKLPNGLYKEYHRIWHLMQGLETSPHYTPLPRHRVTSFHSNGTCILTGDEKNTTLYISGAIVAIGNEANLDFLLKDIKSSLGVQPGVAIDSKHNPLDVDFFTSQSERYPNLYALGPLVGDNFVRFVYGSGLACARDILKTIK